MQRFLRKIFSGVLAGGFFLCCGIISIYAENSSLIITEIHPEAEFIEIQNVSDENISLSGYSYSEETGSGKEKIYEFPEQDHEVLPGNFFVIELSRKINNAGDVVRIYNDAHEKIAEQEIPSSVSGKSYSLIDGTWSWENPTKGSQNSQEEEVLNTEEDGGDAEVNEAGEEGDTYLGIENIIISEILPNPVGTDSESEFIEIYNAGETAISLENLALEDVSGKQFFLSGLLDSQKILLGGGYLSLPYSQTKITINNSDEKILLINVNGQILSQVEFSESTEGQSFSYLSGVYKWTETPTMGEENILTVSQEVSSDSNSSDSSGSLSLFSDLSMENSGQDDETKIVLHIQKIFVSSRPDRVDILCVKCNTSLAGVRLGVDGEVFRIPEFSDNGESVFGKTGDILSFEFENISASEKKKRVTISEPLNSARGPEKTEQGWRFYVPVSGLTATDETIYVGDNNGEILDAVFYSNQNRYFQKSEEEVLGEIIARKEWGKYAREFSGVSTVAFSSQSFLKREAGVDTNTKDDFFRGFVTDDITFSYEGSRQKFPEISPGEDGRIQFSEFYFFPPSPENSGYVRFYIQNTGSTPLALSDYFLSNKERFLTRLDEKQNILFPDQKILIQIPEKKLAHQDVFLEIRERKNKILDVFCLNTSQESGKFRSNRYHQHLLTSPLRENCPSFSLGKNKKHAHEKRDEKSGEESRESDIENVSFTRNNFTSPFSPEIYTQKISFIADTNLLEKSLPEISENSGKTPHGASLFPDIENITPLLSTAELLRQKEQEVIKKRAYLQKKIPIRISRVLPNPKGKDSGQEKIFLKNTSGNFVWLRNFSLKTSGRKNGKTLVMMYFSPYEEKEVQFFSGFTLKNSGETLSLLSDKKVVLDEVVWEKAREGEYFGKFSPRYIPAIKKTKKAQKTSQKKDNTVSPEKSIDRTSRSEKKSEVGKKLPDVVFKSPKLFFFFQRFSVLDFLLFFLVFAGIFSGAGYVLWKRNL